MCATEHLVQGTMQLCFSLSEDKSCDNHCHPSSEHGNLGCLECCIATPLDHEMQENFM